MAGRRSKRVRAARTIPVGFLGAGVRICGDLVDLSTTGVLIRCSDDVEAGTMGILGIPVDYETARIGAVVRRRVPGVGLGFEFLHMSPHARELLHRLLLRLAIPITV